MCSFGAQRCVFVIHLKVLGPRGWFLKTDFFLPGLPVSAKYQAFLFRPILPKGILYRYYIHTVTAENDT